MQNLAENGSAELGLPVPLRDCWQSLVQGANRGKHRFHTGMMGSVGAAGVALRTAVIETEVRSLEWLSLRARGHLRARFSWRNDSLFSTWLIP